MRPHRHALLALLIFAVVSFSLWTATRNNSLANTTLPATSVKVGFQTGDFAPDFELRSLDGQSVRLSSMRGKPVLLNFWATWCAPCRVEMPWLVQLDQQCQAQGVQIVGVSLDDEGSEKDVATFAKDKGVKYHVLLGKIG